MRDDPFHSSKYSIDWAKHHIRELNSLLGDFFASEPYAQSKEIDPKSGDEVYKVKLVKQLPWECVGLVTDATYNLRAALDQAMFALRKEFVYFPIRNDSNEFDIALRQACKGLPDDISNVIRRFKPYRGGNNVLWALNKLCNTNKHGILGPVASASSEIRVGSIGSGSASMPFPLAWDRTKNEMEVLRLPPGTEYSDLEVALQITIYGIEPIQGPPVQDVMKAFYYTVKDIVMTIEAEAKRIGLL